MKAEKEVKSRQNGNGENYNEPALMEIFTLPSLSITYVPFLFSMKVVVTRV
jgi:hypothetical protein